MEATKENIEMLQKVLEHLEGLPDFDEWILQQNHRLPSFQCINFPVWERLWDENADIIGRSVLVYAHHMAWYIEAEVFKAQKFESVSTHDMEVCIHNANEYIPGISSANHMDAVNILRHVWRYGEALNEWYDRERAKNQVIADKMYKPASMTNPITGNTVHFDYAKIEEIDAKYENGIPEEELTAINEFKASIKKFYEEDNEV